MGERDSRGQRKPNQSSRQLSEAKGKTLEAVLVAGPTGWTFWVAFLIAESSVIARRRAARACTTVHGMHGWR